MDTIVVKFGGSSLANAEQIRKAAAIILDNPARRFVVASAPGKAPGADVKVTDLLYACYDAAVEGGDVEAALAEVQGRFQAILDGLGVSFPLESEIDALRAHLRSGPQRDYMASRGEHLNSKILAAFLGFPFVEAADCVCFRADGSFDDEETNRRLAAALSGLDRAVVPGFYGALPDGTIHTFSRGGSDVTGAIVARAVNADLYENWTDVSGMLMTDPRIVDNPLPIDYISYRELRELAYMGATVMHEDAVFPVRQAGIPIQIRNTNRPQDPGTRIVPALPSESGGKVVTGIAGSRGFSSILVEKAMMNAEIGFASKILQILADFNISIEHMPSGIDTLSVVVSTARLAPRREEVLAAIREAVHPDHLSVEDNLAIIAVVGHGMVRTSGTAARVFTALALAPVNIRMIDQGSSELNIILGVAENDYEQAVRCIYAAFPNGR